MIKFLKHKEIDKAKWDECIENASNSLIYAYSWYLDIVCPEWKALVLGKYEAVMPLPVRNKFFISYVYQPYFVQQLGVFSLSNKVNTEDFIKSIPSNYKFVEFNLNEHSEHRENIKKENSNYLLDISKPYSEIVKGYNRNCKRNLKKSIQAEFQIKNDLKSKDFVAFIKTNLSDQISDVKDSTYAILEKLINKSLENKKGNIVGLYAPNKQLHAAGFFLKSKGRYIFSVCASSEFGKQNQAMYYLVDSQIKENSEKHKWFDFSGSNIKGIAYFNSTFGATKTSYQTISINKLPRIIKWLKN